eukprot:20098-Heterococcus_DN1.PRE.5
MEPQAERSDLKAEPLFSRDKCSVSWHADSCLEHYSTIAVYHQTDAAVQRRCYKLATNERPRGVRALQSATVV